jgi:uncharacterized protein YprB with RNaseH-like and TPR domain
MQIPTQKYLEYVTKTNKLAFFDIESSGLKGDYNSIFVVSIKPINSDPFSFSIKQVGNDNRVVREAKQALAQFDCLCGYYSKGFDWPMLNTRLLKWGVSPLEPRYHIDLYYQLKHHILTGRRSQGHLLNWLGTDEQKMGVGASVWSEMGFKLEEHLPMMIERCESDVRGLQQLYEKTYHLIQDVKLQT